MEGKDWYANKFKDKRWQMKRLEIFKRDDSLCRVCNDTTNMNIQLHHKGYIHGREPWDYPDNYFITVCERCHKMINDKDKPKIIVTKVDKSKFIMYIYKIYNKYHKSIKNGFTNDTVDKVLSNIKICFDFAISGLKNRDNRIILEEFVEKQKIFNEFRDNIKECNCEPFQSCEKCKQ
jgi:hypothetical protein